MAGAYLHFFFTHRVSNTCAPNFRVAKCPKCRTPVTSTIPNKTMDSGISDCLSTIRTAASNLAPPPLQPPLQIRGDDGRDEAEGTNEGNSSMEPPSGDRSNREPYNPLAAGLITESQDIGAWTERYESNEAQLKAKAKTSASTSTSRSTLSGSIRVIPPPPIVYSVERFDDAYIYNDGYDCTNALVEYARSGRSQCIHCRTTIPNRSLRFGISRESEMYESSTSFIHAECAPDFNAGRVANYPEGMVANIIRVGDLR